MSWIGILVSKIFALSDTFSDSLPEISRSKDEFVTAFWLVPDVTPLVINPFVSKPLKILISDGFLFVVKLYKVEEFVLFCNISLSLKGAYVLV